MNMENGVIHTIHEDTDGWICKRLHNNLSKLTAAKMKAGPETARPLWIRHGRRTDATHCFILSMRLNLIYDLPC